MFIIWRGWAGGLSLLAIVLGIGLGSGLAGTLHGDNHQFFLLMGLGAIVGGAAAFGLGYWANKLAPRKKAEQFAAARHTELHSMAEQGTFSLGPGHRPPSSVAEAHAQADQLLEAEKRELAAGLTNHHHVWFIPAQYLGIFAGVAGIAMIIASIVI